MIVYFAGAEQKWALKCLVKAQVRNVFMSYFYVPKKKPLKDVLQAAGFTYPIRLMVDSGVFSLIEGINRGKIGKVDWEDYVAGYYEWLKINSPYITTCVNMDLEAIAGCKKVDEWDEKYFYDIEKNYNIEVAHVWHKERGKPAFVQMARKFRYIAFSTMLDGAFNFSQSMSWVRRAGEYGAKVHGLAMTRWDALKKIPFYSVDSTTWLVGMRYGITTFKLPGKEDLFGYGKDQKDQGRKRWKSQIIKDGFDYEGIVADKGAAVTSWFANQFHQMNEVVDKRNPSMWYKGGRRNG